MTKHKSPRRNLSQPAELWSLQDKAASQEGTSWADWARAVLERAALDALNVR